MQIKAKFPSTCGTCNRPIRTGEDIYWVHGQRSTHVQCPAPGEEQKPIPPSFAKKPFVRYLERVAPATTSAPLVIPLPKPSARDHFVALAAEYGTRGEAVVLPEGRVLPLTVFPSGRPMERVLVVDRVEAWYVRANAGPGVDASLNNVQGEAAIAWRLKWSPVVQMAVEGLAAR